MKSLATRSWIRSLVQSWFSPRRQLARKARGHYRLRVEVLEDRVVPTFFQAPYAATLYLTPVGGSAGAVTEFGIGTSIANHTPYFTNLPSNPTPNQEVMVGTVAAGSDLNFYERTVWGGTTYWAFSNLYTSDQASITAFSDPDHDFSSTGNVVAQTSPTTWVLHLDDAASYLFNDNDSDVLMQVRLAPTETAVSALNPVSGSPAGGTSVIITGTNFTGATAVSFGNNLATSYTVNSATQITAIAPAGSGIVDVTVTTPLGTSAITNADQFTYAGVPAVTATSPNTGAMGGGTSVTITGTNFTGATAVMFGTVNATSFTVISPTQITAIAPAGSGVVDVTVVTGQGTSATSSADQFTYTNAPSNWLVANTLASGPGSLFNAVQNANATTNAAPVITFDPTVFATPKTITLTTSLILDNTSEPISIEGPTGVAVTISGNRQGGAQIQDFIINSGAVATIQNLTIADGNAATNNGGGIDINGGTVTIDHCTISNNLATSGAGVSVSGSAVMLLENSTLTGNTAASNGGAIGFFGGSATVVGSLFTNNSALSNGGGGGAIFSGSTSPFTVIDSTFTGNTSYSGYYGGGAIEVINGNLTLIGSTVTGNSNVSGSGSGGGLFNMYPSSSVTLKNDIIWNNTANSVHDVSTGYNGAALNASYSLIGDSDSAYITVNGPGNIFNVAPTSAILGSLANNGGATQTFAPVANSLPVGSGGSVTTANAAVNTASVATLSVASGYVFAASSLLPQLSFVTQPSNTTAGAPMSPVTVQLAGPVDFEEYIQIDSEIMEIVGVTINSDGTATLNVERGVDGSSAVSHAINAPIYLISDQRGRVVNQPTPSVDMGSVQSAGTTPAAGLGLALTMGLTSGTLNGTTTVVTNAAGQAIFNNLSVPTAGTYQLKVAGITTSNSFTVGAGTYPIVTGVSPAFGLSGATVTISGTNFTGATSVSFGAAAATNFTVSSATSITATVPAGAGIVDITVTTPVGTSVVAVADVFTYTSTPLAVTSVNPNVALPAGGTTVTIVGTNFTGATAVMFGTANATSFTINSPTQITAIAPAGSGVVDVTVVAGQGTSATSSADQFTYTNGPFNWIVTNTLASGAGSLFNAVQNANATTIAASIITFDPTVFATPQTITLTTSLVLDNTAQSVRIEGPTGVAVTISGNRSSGAQIQDFIIDSGVVASLQNLTISNGSAGTGNGGGVDIVGGHVTIDHCIISNNNATYGGGLSVTGTTTALIENSTISGNTALQYGGGIFTGGDTTFLTMIDCSVLNNAIFNNTTNTNGQSGGGIYVAGGVNNVSLGLATIIDCTIAGNTATTNVFHGAGGIGTAGGRLVVEGTTITGNSATAGGGVLFEYYYAATLVNDIIWNNTASSSPDMGDSNYVTPTIIYTLVGNTSNSFIPAGSVGNILNVATTPAILGSLANNGGPTQTIAEVANSLPVGSGGRVTVANAAVSTTSAATLSVANGFVFAASSLTPQLSFLTQPANTTAGAPLNPITVQVTNPVDFEEYIRVDSEIMEIVGLTINSDGTATLNVERGVDGTTAATHAANASIYLVSDQRGQVVANQGTPPPVDMGAVQSLATTPAAGAGLALTMGLSSGPLNGVTTVLTNAAGQAVFNTLAVPTTGTFTLRLAGMVTSNSFTVSAGTYPMVTSINPTSGIAGATVNITGTHFTNVTGVSFGGTAVSNFTVVSPTQITAVAPAGSGVEDVTVTTAVGTSAVSAGDHFSYLPSVTGVSPASGSTAGGTTVVITGTNFTGATMVKFGSVNDTNLTVNSATQITVIAPAGATGLVDVTVITGLGTSAVSSADQFTYVVTPTVTGLSANHGPIAGGTSVIITGTGFTGASAVSFGGTAAASFTVNSATQITAISPAETTGTSDITVTTGGGPSATGAADQFTFAATAQSIVVTTSSDAVSHTGISLRDAIATANSDALLGFNDTITFATALNGTTIALVQGAMTLSGAGSGSESINGAGQITVDGGNAQRFLIVSAGVTVAVNGLVIQNMSYGLDAGSGILNSGTLLVTNTTFNHCSGNGGGALTNGGVFEAGGHMTVIGCYFINNTCNGVGGGVANLASGNGVVTISDSSFTANNSAAILNDAGDTMTVTNSTIVGNANTFGIGGGISNAGTITISNCTISGNNEIVGSGGGIGNSGAMTLLNSVVANNTAGTDPDFAASTGTLTGSYNVIGNGTGMSGLTNGVNNNQVGTASVPLLVPISTIANHGGVLPTALLLNSTNPALNTGAAITSLQTAIASTDASLTLANGAAIASTDGAQAVLQIDTEQILVSFTSGNNFNILTRGFNGTTAAAHNAGTGVNYPQYQTTATRTVSGQTDVGAAQDATVAFTTEPPVAVLPSGTFTVALTAIDQAGADIANLPITLHISLGTLTGTTVGTTNASGVATFSGLNISAPGTYTLTATVNNFLVATSTSLSIVTTLPPTVSSLSPNTGPSTGGTSIIITGTGFTGASAVSFGATAASSFTVNSATQITATAPAGSGAVDVTITTTGGTSATSSSDDFTYVAAPTVSGVSPSSGFSSGGATVIITGTNLSGATAVHFGAIPATSFTVNSATQITATSPAGSVGTVNVTVITVGGTSATSSSDDFTYTVLSPTVSAVSPNSGSTIGGAAVTITGTNFLSVQTVNFGATAATNVTVVSPTQITCTSPPGTAGMVNVTVITVVGTSAISGSDHFTYIAPTVLVVTNTSNSAATTGSLPWAVAQANAAASNATITFAPADFTTATTITLASTLTLTNTAHSVTIDGGGAGPISVSGNHTAQVFDIATGVTASVLNLTVENGSANGNGGGIYNAGTLILTNDVVTANAAGFDGGGLYNSGTATLTNVTLSNNSAPGSGLNGGGGAYNAGVMTVTNANITGNTTNYDGAGLNNAGTMVVTNSTFSGNVAGWGALQTHDGQTTVIGSTFTGNNANERGGAVWLTTSGTATTVTLIDCTITGNTAQLAGNTSQQTGGAIGTNDLSNLNLNLVNCTISGNSATVSGGGLFIWNASTVVTLSNSLVAGNSAGTSEPDISGGVSGANNLIGNGDGMTGITNGTNGNQVGSSSSPINPLLNSLGSNGGPTQTMSEQTGSPAIGAAGAVATISAAVSNTSTTNITAANLNLFAASALPTLSSGSYFTIEIDSEQMAVFGVSSSTLTVVRGINGTTAATHASGAALYLVSDQRSFIVPANSPPGVDKGAYQSTAINPVAPAVTAVAPNTGNAGGGTTVVIAGVNFTGATAVFFGSVAATSFTVNSATQITATSPAGTGLVDVTVITPSGVSVVSSADQFTFVIATTTTTLTDNGPNPSTYGQAVSFTVTVGGGADINGETVFIADANQANAIIASPTLTAGTVTFSVSSLSSGPHHLFAVYNGDAAHTASNDSTTPVDQVVTGLVPAVLSVIVNGGPAAFTDSNGLSASTAGQNSVVEQILVIFNESVTLDAGAFTITNNAAGVTVNAGPTPNTLAVTASFAVVPSTNNTQYLVTFSGPGTTAIPGGTGHVIKDGLYILNTIGTHVHANGLTAPTDNNTGFWALYGSAPNGNALTSEPGAFIGDGNSEVFVSNFDYSAFKAAFGSESDISDGPPAPYDVSMDFDLNGFVDNYDYAAFKSNFGADWTF